MLSDRDHEVATEEPSSNAIGCSMMPHNQPHSLAALAVCPLMGLFLFSALCRLFRCQKSDTFPKRVQFKEIASKLIPNFAIIWKLLDISKYELKLGSSW